MRPKTLSASSLQVASLCMLRFEAEHITYGRTMQGTAAAIGSAVHGAFERYVIAVYIKKTAEASLELLQAMYFTSYQEIFRNSDTSSPEYVDGLDLVTRWFERTDFTGREVLSAEVKHRYPIPLSDGTNIPLSYIFDRLDRLAPTIIEVVDYKSNRFPLSQAELRLKIQARIYALMVLINYPEVTEIWVTFDMLRHDGPVSIKFTRADCLETWNHLTAEVARILATESKPKPTMNPECGYCVLKTRCELVQKNVEVGGVMGLSDGELVDARARLEISVKAQTAALAEIEQVLGPKLRPGDGEDHEIIGEQYKASVAARKVRGVDSSMVERVVGDDVFEDYTKPPKITMGEFDKLLKDGRVTDEQRKILRSLVTKNFQSPSIVTEKI